MSLEAVQAQAGHRSIESTRIYLHLSNDWLADEYLRAVESLDADASGLLTRSSRSEPTDDHRTRHGPDGANRAVVHAEAPSPVGGDHALLP